MEETHTPLDIDYTLPKKLNYDIKILDRFFQKHHECNVIFYGGEPLMCIDKIKQIMDHVKVNNFLIQTNGLLLDQLESKYINRFHTIMVSIDGEKKLTDYYRGKNTFTRVMNNLKLITDNGFRGELIARMTVMEKTDIYKQVRFLLENNFFPFRSIHWQLNAGFWNDFSRRSFQRWILNNYNPGIRSLIQFWIENMKQTNEVLRLFPFMGITQTMLKREKSRLRCGAGWINYTIQTDGNIITCPNMWGIKNYYVGNINMSSVKNLKKMFVTQPCSRCEILDHCGGRCLYANILKRWTQSEYRLICNTVFNLKNEIETRIPEIEGLITQRKIKLENFEYMKFNGCEIIP